MQNTISVLIMQKAAKAKHFHTGLYFQKKPHVLANETDEMEAGAPFKYGITTNIEKLEYFSAHIGLATNDLVIETYAPFDWVQKGKVQLEGEKLFQIKEIMHSDEDISPVARITKYTLFLG